MFLEDGKKNFSNNKIHKYLEVFSISELYFIIDS